MIKRNLIEYQLKTKIVFGTDCINQISDYARPFGDKAILITDGSTYSKLGYISKVKALLEKSGMKLIIYEDINSNIKSDAVDEIAELVRKSKANLVIGLGGTTVINVSKAVAMLATNSGSMSDYLNGQKM